MLYRLLARPLLFRLPAEQAHDLALGGLELLARRPALCRLLRRLSGGDDPRLVRTLCGLRFPGPLGIAGGLDKDGRAVAAWAALGFGFVELGTVTAQAQPGNPAPRMFRLPSHSAVINRMGFNNRGAAALAERLAKLPWRPFPIGVSIGKSKQTPVEAAIDDYVNSFRLTAPHADYLAINISSPNTVGLRGLQERAALEGLLEALQAENQRIGPRPLLVKLAPDLSDDALEEAVAVCIAHGVSGLIAVNTTLSRAGISGPYAGEAGGLSGAPLRERALAVVSLLAKASNGQLPIIGVGGIASADDAKRMIAAGATLLQIYTGLVYEGPGLVQAINRAL